jgi:hypothetical protein
MKLTGTFFFYKSRENLQFVETYPSRQTDAGPSSQPEFNSNLEWTYKHSQRPKAPLPTELPP